MYIAYAAMTTQLPSGINKVSLILSLMSLSWIEILRLFLTLLLGLLSLLLRCTANLVLATVTSCGWYYCWWLMTDATPTAKTLINLTHFAASISSFFSFFSFTFSAPSFHLQCWDFCCLLLSATFVSTSFSIEMYFQSVHLIIYLFIFISVCIWAYVYTFVPLWIRENLK